MRFRCRCGQWLAVPENRAAALLRCPACGTVSRVSASTAPGAPVPPPARAASGEAFTDERPTAPADPQPPEGDDEYSLKHEPAAPQPTPFVPVHTSTLYSPSPARRTKPRRRAESDDDDYDSRPFLSAAALLYPWVYPNCFYWLCLSVLSSLCMVVVILSLFVIGVLPFWLASALMVWLALASYIVAAFELIIEQTAHGEDHMQGLPEIGWGEVLPPFLRAFGAMCCAIAVPVGLSYLICRWLPVPGVVMFLPGAVIAYLLFPLFLITNLIDETFIPLKSIPDVIVRVAKQWGYFVVFLVIIAWLSMVLAGAVALVFYWNVVAGLFALGPISATWLMYYGHLLGRLGEKLMELE